MNPGSAQRFAVIGTTGCGKTTTARQIAARRRIPQVELDALHWGPNWDSAPLRVFRARVREAVSGSAWVVDGNYSKVRDIVWPRAELLVWLDYPLAVVLRQLLLRTLRRTIWRTELWHGNRESALEAFFSPESILLWAVRTHRSHRAEYPRLFCQSQYAHLAVARLRSPGDARAWLDEWVPRKASSSRRHDGQPSPTGDHVKDDRRDRLLR